jgi:large conductance mechanosensitive channel
MKTPELWQDLKSFKPPSLWQDFKSFAFKGSMIDLAVAVVIGTASTAVINSLVQNIIMPLVSYVVPGQESYQAWRLGRVEIGVFLGQLVNFLVLALTVFLVVVKLFGTIKKVALPPGPDEPITKECPLCLSIIPTKARKCAHCTADLPS